MYPSIHSLAHRAPPATRTRVRWQPYGSLPSSASSSSLSSVSSRSPTNSSVGTPASSAPSSPPPISDVDRIKPHQQLPTPQPQTPRDAQPREKSKYALGLVDQAVKSLCEIWRPQDIPHVFLTSSRAMVPGTGSEHVHTQIQQSPSVNNSHSRTYLPSLLSPSTQPSPPQLFPSVTQTPTSCDDSVESLLCPRNVVPMKNFVHEVLRRSRTSGSVLQTALCYLEAIRSKVPELVRLEKAGEGARGEPELAERITLATEAELQQEAELSSGLDTIILTDSDDGMDTVRPTDSYSGSTAVCSDLIEDGDSTLKKPKAPSPPLVPLPSLPSPLLCPRRAFLASLILASKFTQDKCYSNRAWAKLSGLPPREIGRCERALGDALEWRLWVGKVSSSSQQNAAATSAPATRTLGRSQSEALLRPTSSDRGGFLVAGDKLHTAKPATLSPPVPSKGLRRAATLPAGMMESKLHHHNHNAVSMWIHNSMLTAVDDHLDHTMCSPELPPTGNHDLQRPNGGNIPDISISEATPSLSPSTPGLSYSPTSTESSSGDRTIQMSVFDDNMMPYSIGAPSVASDMWPWLDTLPSGQGVVNVSPLPSFDKEYKHVSAVQDLHISLGAKVPDILDKSGPLGSAGAIPPVRVWGIDGVNSATLSSWP